MVVLLFLMPIIQFENFFSPSLLKSLVVKYLSVFPDYVDVYANAVQIFSKSLGVQIHSAHLWNAPHQQNPLYFLCIFPQDCWDFEQTISTAVEGTSTFQRMLRHTDALNAHIQSFKESGSKRYPKSVEMAKVFEQKSNLLQIITFPSQR